MYVPRRLHKPSLLLSLLALSTITLVLYRTQVASTQRPFIQGIRAVTTSDRQLTRTAPKKQPAPNVRVLAWVMTSHKDLLNKGVHLKATWGRRADRLLFFSSKHNETFPAIGLNVSEGRQHLTEKTWKAFKYVYNFHLGDAEWFMKVDTDTYVIMENLRLFLRDKDPSVPAYYGRQFFLMGITSKSYYSGGGGYVLSKAALKLFATQNNRCKPTGQFEDLDFGNCMQELGVSTVDTRDSKGRSRFHSMSAAAVLDGHFPDWLRQYSPYKLKSGGADLMSDHAITFHYTSPKAMYQLEYLLYRLHPEGLEHSNPAPELIKSPAIPRDENNTFSRVN